MTDQAPSLNFTAFVFSLMHTTAVHLGDAPDPNTGQGYVYLPGRNDPDANWVINRPADGKWSTASVEWSAVINSQLAATTR